MKKLYLTHRLAAMATTAALVGGSVSAEAATNIGSVTGNLYTSASSFPKMISTVAYIAGIGMSVTGVYKLKQHVDKPEGVPMKDGLVRLAVGGALLSLPYMTQVMAGTVAGDSSGSAVKFSGTQFEMGN